MKIQLLAPDVAAKIAAGEVVERPANVAKELIENSLDAGATDIRVEVREGGQRLLRIADNGHGIAADEIELAFARHATSKLQEVDDLNHIATLGFRGEALYSIAAVSHVTLASRRHGAEYGAQIRLEGGHVVESGKAGVPVGTIVTVEQLFYNVPARLKFLRKAATEAGQIAAVVQHYALANPGCRFLLTVDGRTVLQTGGNRLGDALVTVYGLESARQMVPIGAAGEAAPAPAAEHADEVEFMDDAPLALGDNPGAGAPPIVTGYIGLPTLTRPNRTGIELYVNRRYVEDRSLTHAVVQAYHTLLPVGRFPVAIILVDIAPDQVDVNVHPQKTQVRFLNERQVFSAVQKAVRAALVRHAPPPEFTVDVAPAPAPAWDDREAWAARRAQILGAGEQHAFDLRVPPPVASPALAPAAWDAQPADVYPPVQRPIAPPDRAPEDAPASGKLPPLRVVGQAGAMYIIAEGPQGLYLIDQHAAHERILYERYMAQAAAATGDGVPRQHLLEPLTLHVGHEVTGLVAQQVGELTVLGFEIEPFGGDTFLVRAVPAVLAGEDPLRVLQEIASSLANQRNLVGEELEARMVTMICKRAAIKAGQLLSDIEMQELVRQLEACHSPRTCPHGRPTMIQLSAGELEKAFGRT